MHVLRCWFCTARNFMYVFIRCFFLWFRSGLNTPSYLGILGPTFRVAVGDTIRVVFRNNLSFPVNIVPLGLFYSSDKVAQPGATVVYYWTASSSSGPDSNDVSTVPWLYRSTVRKKGPVINRCCEACIQVHSRNNAHTNFTTYWNVSHAKYQVFLYM